MECFNKLLEELISSELLISKSLNEQNALITALTSCIQYDIIRTQLDNELLEYLTYFQNHINEITIAEFEDKIKYFNEKYNNLRNLNNNDKSKDINRP